MKFKYGLLVVSLLFYFLVAKESLAITNKDLNINYPAITPTSEFYPVKRLWEKVFPFVLFSKNSRFNYSEGLLKNVYLN